jgi:Mce-associated membrane protein
MTTLTDDTEDTADTEATVTGDDETVDDDAKVATMTKRETKREKRPIAWSRVVAYGVFPGLALLLAVAAGYLLWTDGSTDGVASARTESVRVASEDAVALLSYKAESADKDLNAARDRVVIPGAKEKQISTVVKVSAAASVSATANNAVVLLFANQTVTMGQGVPTDTQPVIKVTLDKINGRWLVSHFDPV